MSFSYALFKIAGARVSTLNSQPWLPQGSCSCTFLASIPTGSVECKVPFLLPTANSISSPSLGPHQSFLRDFSIFLSTGSFPHINVIKSLLSSGKWRPAWLAVPSSYCLGHSLFLYSQAIYQSSVLFTSSSSILCCLVSALFKLSFQRSVIKSHRPLSIFVPLNFLEPSGSEDQFLFLETSLFWDFQDSPLQTFPIISSSFQLFSHCVLFLLLFKKVTIIEV